MKEFIELLAESSAGRCMICALRCHLPAIWHFTLQEGHTCRGLSRRRKRLRIMAPTCAPLLVLRNTSSGLQPPGSFSLSILYCAQDVTAGPRHQPCLRICMERVFVHICSIHMCSMRLHGPTVHHLELLKCEEVCRPSGCSASGRCSLLAGGIMYNCICWRCTFVPPAPSELDT